MNSISISYGRISLAELEILERHYEDTIKAISSNNDLSSNVKRFIISDLSKLLNSISSDIRAIRNK